MVSSASSVSIATTPSMSPRSNRSAKRVTISRSCGESGSGARSRTAGRASSAARARWSALLTEASLRLEHLGDLGGAQPEHVAQHEHRALARGQVLEAGDERERDRLAQLVARLRAGRGVGDALQQRVRVGLEPQRLAAAGRLGRRHRPFVARCAGAARRRAGSSGSGSWRSCRARRAARRAPRSGRGRARRRAASPAGRPRRPARSRASGSSGRAARAGRGR